MRSFLFLWGASIAYLLGDFLRFFLWHESLSQFFFPVFFVFLLPIWIFSLAHIEKDRATSLVYPSLPRVGFFIVTSSLALWYLSLSILPAILMICTLAVILLLIDSRIFLIFSFLTLIVIAVLLFTGQVYLAMSLAPSVYLSALLSLVSGGLVGIVASRTKKIAWMSYAPLEWKYYLDEMQWVIKWYIRIGVWIFPISIIYIIFQKTTWILFLNSSVPMFLAVLFYFSFLVVPLQGDPKKPFSLRI